MDISKRGESDETTTKAGTSKGGDGKKVGDEDKGESSNKDDEDTGGQPEYKTHMEMLEDFFCEK